MALTHIPENNFPQMPPNLHIPRYASHLATAKSPFSFYLINYKKSIDDTFIDEKARFAPFL